MNNETQIESARGGSVWPSTLNIIAGIWLIIAPFVLASGNPKASANDVVLGIIIGIFALIRALVPTHRTVGLSWLNALWGIWLIICPFALAYHAPAAQTNDIILGIIVLIFGIWSANLASPLRATVIR
jgi:hypothetical protein